MATATRTTRGYTTDLGLVRQVNVVLREQGLRWCQRCGPVDRFRDVMELLVAGGELPEQVGAAKPADEFPPTGARCRVCLAISAAARYEVRRADPVGAEQLRDNWRAQRARKLEHEDYLARQASYARDYRARLRKDPARWREHLENRRIDERLRRERDGLPMREGSRRAPGPVNAVVPVGPFREWLAQAHAMVPFGEIENVAKRMGVASRSIRRLIEEDQPWVSVAFADKAVTGFPRLLEMRGVVVYSIAQLYGELVPLDVPTSKAALVFGHSRSGRVLRRDERGRVIPWRDDPRWRRGG